jgi:hypothetical protein
MKKFLFTSEKPVRRYLLLSQAKVKREIKTKKSGANHSKTKSAPKKETSKIGTKAQKA